MSEVENLNEAKEIMLDMLDEVVSICEKNKIKYWLDFGTLLGAIRHKGFIPWDDDIDISMPRRDYEKFIKIAKKQLSSYYFLQHPSTDSKYIFDWIKIRHKDSLFLEHGDQKDEGSEYKGIFIDIFPIDFIKRKNLKRYNLLKKIYQINPSKNLYKSKTSAVIQKCFGFLNILKPSIDKYIQNQLLDESSENLVLGHEMWIYKNYPKKWVIPLKKGIFEGRELNIPSDYHKLLSHYYGNYMKIPEREDRINHSYHIEIYQKPMEKDNIGLK